MSGEELRLFTTNPVRSNGTASANFTQLSEKEKAALELLNQIAGKKEYKESMSTDDLRKELEKDLKALHTKRSRDDRKRGVDSFSPINDDTYRTAMDVLEKQMDIREEANLAYAQSKVREITGEARELLGQDSEYDVTKHRQIRSYVRDQLKEEFEAGNLTEEQYAAARKYGETKKGTHFFKSIWRGVFGGTKESSELYRTAAQNNNVTKIRTSEDGPQYDAELQAKLDKAGISVDDIYQVGDNLVGSEAVVSYSNRKVQAGEAQFITDELNRRARNNGSDTRFSVKEAKEIMKGAGYGIEKKIDAKKVIRDMAIPTIVGGGVGVPLIPVQNQNVNLNYGEGIEPETIHQDQTVAIAPAVTAALAAGLSALSSIKEQATRVEDKAIPVDIHSDIQKYEDYVDFVLESESFPSKQAKAMAMKIAAYYTDDKGNLLKDQLIDAYRHAGGSADPDDKKDSDNYRDASVLNHREALTLLSKLESGEITVDKPDNDEVVVPTEKPYVHLQEEIVKEVKDVEIPTECYEVKAGDNWDIVVRNVYGITDEADVKYIRTQIKKEFFNKMKAEGTLPAGVTSWRDGFFPRAGEELCLPTVFKSEDGKREYKLNVNADFERKMTDSENVSFGTVAAYRGKTEKQEVESRYYVVNDSRNEERKSELYAGEDKAEAERQAQQAAIDLKAKGVTTSVVDRDEQGRMRVTHTDLDGKQTVTVY